MSKRAVISLSGGMDSASLLAMILAEKKYDHVHCYGFDYGQRHRVELQNAELLVTHLANHGHPVSYQIINVVDVFSDSQSALGAKQAVEVPKDSYSLEVSKQTVVENRNVIFSSIIYGKALAISKLHDCDVDITLGMHANDHCFTKNTKFLTKDGVKALEDLRIGDHIYSLNNMTNQIEDDKVSFIIKKGGNSEIHHIKTNAGKLELTSDHKVFRLKLGEFDRTNGYRKSIEKVMAKDIKPGDFLIQPSNLTNQSIGNDIVNIKEILEKIKIHHNQDFKINEKDGRVWISKDYLIEQSIPAQMETGDFVEYIAWYITEGSSAKCGFQCDNKSGSKYRAEFHQSIRANFEKVEDIEWVIKHYNLPTKRQFRKDISGMPKEICYYHSNAMAVIMKDCGSNSHTKVIPDWLMEILTTNSEARQRFISTMVDGDGHRGRYANTYSSVSKELIEQMAFLVTISGYYYTYGKNGNVNTIQFQKPGRKAGSATLGDAKFAKVLSNDVVVGYEDVYDITVENNHNFFAGNDGFMLISNSTYPDCQPESVEMSKELYRISNWGSERIDYISPLIHMTKTEVLGAGLEALQGLGIPYNDYYAMTSSCYDPIEYHGASYSCGLCATCRDRLAAFEAYGLQDPTRYTEDYKKLRKAQTSEEV